MQASRFWIAILCACGFASYAYGVEASIRSWSTTSHLGFAVVDQSTTGFDRSMGSLVFLDIEKVIAPKLALGFRTIAQGAKLGERAFYRLGTGPLLSYRVTDHWVIQAAATRFDETGVGEEDARQYRSKGSSTQLGWERIFHFGPRVEFAWGGFVIAHQGDLDVEPAAVGQTGLSSSHNSGLGHGVEAALRVDL